MSLESGTDASTTAVEQTRLNQPDEKTATRVTTYDDRTEPEFAVECTEPPAVDCGQVSPSRTSEAFLWLTRQDQFVAGLLCCVALGLLGVHWYRMGLSETPRQVIERPDLEIGYCIDINRASWPELTQLKGVGPKLARRIVEDRNANGPFSSVDDLGRVRRVGRSLIDRNRAWLKAESTAGGDETTGTN